MNYDYFFSVGNDGDIKEGGNSRNHMLIYYFRKNNTKSIIINPSSVFSRIFSSVIFLYYYITLNNKKIFFTYSSLRLSLLSERVFGTKIGLYYFQYCINAFLFKNDVTIEVNDLPYEQSIDLNLRKNSLNHLDKLLFSTTNTKFIFSSQSMMNYCINKYGFNESRASVIINGGNPLLKKPLFSNNKNALKFVYAGTLNKGRQIIDMIEVFSNFDHSLYLMGTQGDWLNKYLIDIPNIHYLGAVNELVAHEFVSFCDCGVIPYDDTKLYYNICFPIKASFYITAQIPVLSTMLLELMNHFHSGEFIFSHLKDWGKILGDPDLHNIIYKSKIKVSEIYDFYIWDNILNSASLLDRKKNA